MASQPSLGFEDPPHDDRFLSAILRVSQQLEAVAKDVGGGAEAGDPPPAARDQRRGEAPAVAAVNALGGRCPCCGSAEVVDQQGRKAVGAEFDHFYAASKPDVEHTWLIYRPCHGCLTTGRIARDEREAEFRAYQSKRRRLVPRPARLL
jgi:hypothetical protein